MAKESRITFTQLLQLLRQRVLTAQNEKDLDNLGELQIVFDTLSEIVSEMGDVKTASLLEDMACTTRDICMGNDWKSEFPSVEQIKKVMTSA